MSDILIPAGLAATETAPVTKPAAKPDAAGFIWGTGRRKTAIARVRIRPGTGSFQVKSNGDYKAVEDFFTVTQQRESCVAALKLTQTATKLDVFATVTGGGTTGQAEAILMGVARALKSYDPNLELALRQAGYLTRDSRKVERKKYGRSGARRRFQFSKR